MVNLADFMEQLKTNETAYITAPTFSRLLNEFLQENGIIKYRESELQTILQRTIREAISKGIYGRDDLRKYITDFLRTRQIYSPSPLVLDRLIGNIAKDALRISEAENIHLISDTIGMEFTSLEFVKEFIIEFSGVLQLPGIHFSKELVEKLHPSEAVRSSKELFAVHLQKYYAARYQDSIDAMVQCCIKTARLMRFRANKSYNENSGKDSREFIEEINDQFQEIHDAMKSDTIFVLEDYKEFFEIFEPLVLVTLADFIASGRIIVEHSFRYRNKWIDVPGIDSADVDSDEYVGKMKSDLSNIWREFIAYTQTHPEICLKGRINEKRLPSSTGKDEELRRKAKIDAFIESLEVKDITKLLWTVHELTGFLDSFKLVNS